MNFKSLKAALGQAVQQGATYAKDLSSQVVGAKVLRDYTLGGQVASGGPGCLWKVHTARCKREGAANALVSVWFLDKRLPDDLRHDGGAWDDFLELCRKDAANLTRLKHPGIVKLVEPFEETRNQLVLVTEPIILSLANVLHEYDGLPAAVSVQHRDLKMSELERKHGLLQISDTLHFLHAEANLVHCGLCPEAVFLTGAGAWKLASLAHCVQVQYTVDEAVGRTFDYASGGASARLLAPLLTYVAPELIASNGASAPPPLSPASDMFSLGCIAYELLAQRPFMPPRCSVTDHQARVAGLALMDLAPINVGFQSVMRQLLAGTASMRPSATAFQGATYFQDDVLVRALRFLDNLLQRDNLQKAAFLKDAARLWPRLDLRVLRYAVLPPLLVELRNEALQALVLPLVLGIIPQQDEPDFMDWTLPSLLPIATSAKGDALLVFTRNAALLATSMPPEAVRRLIVPLLVRAADQGDAQTQEEMVKAVPMLADVVAYEDLKAELLPRVCGLCLSTSSAGVRTGALMAMGKLLPSIEVDEAKKMMAICAKVVGIDHTPGTTMCVVGLGSAVARQWGASEGARSALPVMTPCLAVAELTPQQYTTASRSVREILAALDVQRTAAGSTVGSGASSTGSLSALDALPAPSGAAAAGRPASASSSPRPAYEPAKVAPAAASRLAPPAKANTLADAFTMAADAPAPAAVPPLPGAAAAADDIFDFQPINRGGGSSSGPGHSTSSMGGQPVAGSMGAQPNQQPKPMKAPMMGQAPTMGQAPADDFGDFGGFSGAPQPQPQQHAALSSAIPAPTAAPKHDSGFDSLI